MEHFLLALVLITADGPQQKVFEYPSLEECWKAAHSMMAKMEKSAPEMSVAGFSGYGAGCLVVTPPTQESSR